MSKKAEKPKLLTMKTFEPFVGDKFVYEIKKGFSKQINEVQTLEFKKGDVIEFKLEAVTESKYNNEEMEAFSLSFIGPKNIIFTQATYQLNHKKLGNISLFLVPSGHDYRGTLYHCSISRLRNQPTEEASEKKETVKKKAPAKKTAKAVRKKVATKAKKKAVKKKKK